MCHYLWFVSRGSNLARISNVWIRYAKCNDPFDWSPVIRHWIFDTKSAINLNDSGRIALNLIGSRLFFDSMFLLVRRDLFPVVSARISTEMELAIVLLSMKMALSWWDEDLIWFTHVIVTYLLFFLSLFGFSGLGAMEVIWNYLELKLFIQTTFTYLL